jgi:hypothetical protein
LHEEELHNVYSSSYIIITIQSRRMRWAVYVARIRETKNEYRFFVGDTEGRRPIGEPRPKLEDNISRSSGKN